MPTRQVNVGEFDVSVAIDEIEFSVKNLENMPTPAYIVLTVSFPCLSKISPRVCSCWFLLRCCSLMGFCVAVLKHTVACQLASHSP